MTTGIDHYQQYLGPRYVTFRAAFDGFKAMGGRTVVELGTTRSFVSGDFPGCMSTDPQNWHPHDPSHWDWGAGMFTKMCAIELRPEQPRIHSVDISPEALQIARVIVAEDIDLVTLHHTSSEEFLSTFPEKIDLLYMDAGETGDQADELHAREAAIVLSRQLLSPRGLVLIDDVNIPGSSASKGRLSIPLYLKHGFQVRSAGYQVLLQAA